MKFEIKEISTYSPHAFAKGFYLDQIEKNLTLTNIDRLLGKDLSTALKMSRNGEFLRNSN